MKRDGGSSVGWGAYSEMPLIHAKDRTRFYVVLCLTFLGCRAAPLGPQVTAEGRKGDVGRESIEEEHYRR